MQVLQKMGGVCAGYKIPRKVLMTGLRGSGKTSLLYYWCLGCETRTTSTDSFNVETVNAAPSAGLFLVWDVTDPVRRRQFYHGTEAVVYVIDGSTVGNLDSVREDLQAVLNDRDLKELPLLLVLTKLDQSSGPNSISEIDPMITDRQFEWTGVRKDDPRTYQDALKKLCLLVYS